MRRVEDVHILVCHMMAYAIMDGGAAQVFTSPPAFKPEHEPPKVSRSRNQSVSVLRKDAMLYEHESAAWQFSSAGV